MANRKKVETLLANCGLIMRAARLRVVAVFSELDVLHRVVSDIMGIITDGAMVQTVIASTKSGPQFILIMYAADSLSNDELTKAVFYLDNLRANSIAKEYSIL